MLDQLFPCSTASAFGLEGPISAELKRLGMRDIIAENGCVRFRGTLEEIYLCNLRLRFSDRVYINMAEGPCSSFEDLFRMVIEVPWENYTEGSEAFNITAQCARSRLMSLRACQSVAKKAVLERLKKATGQQQFPESGAAFPIHISIHSDRARIMLDTSGSSLSRRGYRTWNGEAPLLRLWNSAPGVRGSRCTIHAAVPEPSWSKPRSGRAILRPDADVRSPWNNSPSSRRRRRN